MSDATAPDAQPVRKPFPWRTALFGSLALNLLLIGGAVGALMSNSVRFERPGGHERMAFRDGPPRSGFMRALPDADRAKVRAILRQSFTETRELRQAARAAREDVEALAAAEAFDAEAMRAALARVRDADLAVTAQWHGAVADAMAGLGPNDRRAAIEAFVRDRFGGRGDRHRGRDRGEGAPPPAER